MRDIKKYELEWAGEKLTIELGRFAGQAHGACTVQLGETMILATAVLGGAPRDGIDYFPLMVDYEERLYAAGKISGSRFVKREGRPTEEAVLTARVVDRSIRPLFDQSLRKDVQVSITVLSMDDKHDPDICAVIGASLALMISPIPWSGPLAAVRVTELDGALIVNSSFEERKNARMDLFVSGTDKKIVMIETAGKQCPDDVVKKGLAKALETLAPVVELLEKIQQEMGKSKIAIPVAELTVEEKDARTRIDAIVEQLDIRKAFGHKEADAANQAMKELKTTLQQSLADQNLSGFHSYASEKCEERIGSVMRDMVLKEGVRADGRALDEIRPINCEIALLPRTHGSGCFTRGETQVLSVVTLGSPGDEQLLDGMEIEGSKRFMHHYNFPPFSVGEVAPMRGPGRREIGHGALAEKALEPVMPTKEEFPYTIRVVSEVLESNGSSSQASACGSTLALLDAGVPLKAPVAGIAMGLIMSEDESDYRVITDIKDIEDHSGCMDFKVAGTIDGVTAVQVDIKLKGISLEVCEKALDGARKAREEILGKMAAVIKAPKELSAYAPRIETLKIDPEKIRDLIGPGGKVINKIIEETEVAIDIEDEGMVFVTSENADGMRKAIALIENIIRDVEVDAIYTGKVTQIISNDSGDVGAIVELWPGKDGMVHISELQWARTEHVSDVVNIGDEVKVKVLDVDKERGRVSLSIKALMEKPEGFIERPRFSGGRGHDSRGPRHIPRRPFRH